MFRLYGQPGGFTMTLVVAASLILGVDAVVRWSQLLNEVRPPSGFWEWAFRRRGPRIPRRP
jgi:hypothetical protein